MDSISRGSSPRVRGKLVEHFIGSTRGRLIPACAGKTFIGRFLSETFKAHPRVCGENATWGWADVLAMGSSPRVRGKPLRGFFPRPRKGLIPACAGKTQQGLPLLRQPRAHPRVCGENPKKVRRVSAAVGSSPRVRGKRRSSAASIVQVGLIPACAGKTTSRRSLN